MKVSIQNKEVLSPGNNSVLTILEKILSSSDFKATSRQKNFLSYIVNKYIEGRVEEIKGYTIATEVFGRMKFDQTKDPIVSIEARRLRRALEYYYQKSGKNDLTVIEIPKGSYVPIFKYAGDTASPDFASGFTKMAGHMDEQWPTVLIRPFQVYSDNKQLKYIAEGFKAELAVELSRFQDIRVLVKPTAQTDDQTQEPESRFILEGNIRADKDQVRLVVQLMDRKNNRQIWAESYQRTLSDHNIISTQEEIAKIISAEVGQEYGIIPQTIAKEYCHKTPSEIQTYEALLKFYMHETTFSPESFECAYDALEQAVVKEPDCAQAWSFLGRLNSENYCIDYYDRNTSVEKAIQYSENAINLNPLNQRSRAGLALAYLQNNQIQEGKEEIQQALSLNPSSCIFLDVIGHIKALLGDWTDGCSLIRKCIAFNPYHRPYVYHTLFLEWLLKEDYENAYLETLKFRLSPVFWEWVFRAVSLAQLGRMDDAKKAVQQLLTIRPNFQNDGRSLMQRTLKSELLLDRLLSGLTKAGLEVS